MTAESLDTSLSKQVTGEERETLITVMSGILGDLRKRHPSVSELDFFDGCIAALVCSRRTIEASEYWPRLFGVADEVAFKALFANEVQFDAFKAHWEQRWAETKTAIQERLSDPIKDGQYVPIVFDRRCMTNLLPPKARAKAERGHIPSFGQTWAEGFMSVVEGWPEEWTPPRNRVVAQCLSIAIGAIAVLLEPDLDPPTQRSGGEGNKPSFSTARAMNLVRATRVIYELYDIWHTLGPRVSTVQQGPKPGRNDPCSCGSGKKYKKCCGQG